MTASLNLAPLSLIKPSAPASLLGGDEQVIQAFSEVPASDHDRVYYHLWESTGKKIFPDYGKHAFHGTSGQQATQAQKLAAIHLYKIEKEFAQLSKESQGKLYGHLWKIHGSKPGVPNYGKDAFHGTNGRSSTLEERLTAVKLVQAELDSVRFLGKSERQIQAEFDAITTYSKSIDYEKHTALSREKGKDRCTYSFPYDKTVVPLSKGRFINASYIFSGRQIHSQFPRKAITEEHFEMLYEQGVSVAHMLPQVGYEGRDDAERSFLYVPDKAGEIHTYGNMVVKCLKKEQIKDCPLILRKIEFGLKDKPARVLHHLQTIGWVDNEVPAIETAKKASQLKMKIQEAQPGPSNLHCMAGVGRTPTQGIIDELYEAVWSGATVDIAAVAKSQRDPETGRTPHQLNLRQYSFLYECLEDVRREGAQTQQEIVDCFTSGRDKRALELFNEAPQSWRHRVFGAVYKVMGSPSKVPHNYGELAFYDRDGHTIPSAKKAEALLATQ